MKRDSDGDKYIIYIKSFIFFQRGTNTSKKSPALQLQVWIGIDVKFAQHPIYQIEKVSDQGIFR